MGRLTATTPAKLAEDTQPLSAFHANACFARPVPEPWEHEPLGRIAQVGIEHLLLILGHDGKLVPFKAWTHGFPITKRAFHAVYQEVPCPDHWK